jgi:hypothetical protein
MLRQRHSVTSSSSILGHLFEELPAIANHHVDDSPNASQSAKHWPEGTRNRKLAQQMNAQADAHQEYGHQMQVCGDTPNALESSRRGKIERINVR